MQLKSWQLVLATVAVSFMLALAEVPAADRFTTAAISMSAGVAALSLMAASALLGASLGFVV